MSNSPERVCAVTRRCPAHPGSPGGTRRGAGNQVDNDFVSPRVDGVTTAMISIFVTVTNFDYGQLNELNTLISEYDNMENFKIHVNVDTTIPLDLSQYKNITTSQRLFDKSIGHYIPMMHRTVIAENVDKYDLYIFSESDILIKESTIDRYLNETSLLPKHCITGFLRFELQKVNITK